MDKQQMREKYFDLWTNQLPTEEAQSLMNIINADADLQREFLEDKILFETLQSFKGETIDIPENFAASVTERLAQRGFLHVLWRKVMQIIRSFGWLASLSILLPGLFLLTCAGLFLTPLEMEMHSMLDPILESRALTHFFQFFEGPGSVLLMLILFGYAIFSLPMKSFRLGAAAVTAGLAVFFVRTFVDVSYKTDALIMLEDPKQSQAPLEKNKEKVENEKKLMPPSPKAEAYEDIITRFESDLNSIRSDSKKSNAQDPALQKSMEEYEGRAAKIFDSIVKKMDGVQAGPSGSADNVQQQPNVGANGRQKSAIKGYAAEAAAAPSSVFSGILQERWAYTGAHEVNTERYGQYEENPRFTVEKDPVSTFSMDVDTGSYSNIRRFLRLGQLPPKDAVRIEELVNYFPYSYEASGDKPFGVNYEIAPSPLSKGRYLVKVGLKAREAAQDRSKGWNLVFLVDTSGSMAEPNKLPLVKQSLKLLTDSMRKEDKIALVTYAGSAGVVLPSTSGEEKQKIRAAIDSLDSAGSTNGEAGIDLAYAQAEANKISGSVNRVILATDGDFNVGISDFNGLVNLIEKKRKNGITLTTLGFGTGNYQEQSMEQLADKGNGNYFYIDSFQEAKKVLSSELTQAMEVVAKDVKLQIEFNPAQVKEYRLVGFDNRILKREDFTNDKIDAGEVGSGHTVTALYEVELTSKPVSDSTAQNLRYQQPAPLPTATKIEGELGFLKIRAKEPEGETSKEYSYPINSNLVKDSIDKASDDFKFAASVAGYGALLRDSKYLGDFTWDDIRALAEKSRGSDPFGYRSEFLTLVDAAKALSGK